VLHQQELGQYVRKKARKAPKKIQKMDMNVVLPGPVRRGEAKKPRPKGWMGVLLRQGMAGAQPTFKEEGEREERQAQARGYIGHGIDWVFESLAHRRG